MTPIALITTAYTVAFISFWHSFQPKVGDMPLNLKCKLFTVVPVDCEEVNVKLREIEELLDILGKKHPKEMGAFSRFLKEVIDNKTLTTREKELIAVALGIAQGCEWCIALHTHKALEAGAKPEELIEAGLVAVLMAGGPALMHLIPLMKAIENFQKGAEKD
ncbi:carboxymuconolactone decarboxylase family protein [Thermococcus thermotolerans]|uniref:carboxymuconolactone decarboxylase family protein n=1 Tax=Thermococcus thermotolerans TaxID=2969672 RepID=UPI0021587E39|nr:carboxymuconolactone decarboxylase family protein [Thermococcus thermotolerans]